MKLYVLTLFLIQTASVFGGLLLPLETNEYQSAPKAPRPLLRDNFEERGKHFEGDIILSAGVFSGVIDTKYRWPNAQIPYVLDSKFSSSEKATIKSGMEDISSHTCIKFAERQTEKDYVFIQRGGSRTGCNSYVGRQGGQQTVNLEAPGCLTKGIASHELIHAIGFRHEHSRSDRDKYIRVIWDNIQKDYHYAFNTYGPEVVSDFGVSYDYGSIMHYSAYAFATDKSKPTISTLQGGAIGQRVQLSSKDAQKIKNMYQCP